MKNTEETQPQILIQPTPMHCIQSVFEPYLITSGRYFGTTCTITRTNTTGCAASPTSTSSASPSVGQQICTIGSGCTPMFGSQLSKSHTGGQESGLESFSEAAKEHSKTNNIIIGEASASTMWDNNAWIFFYDNSTEGEPPFLIQDFIHAFQPNAKLIIMLRDPVERLYSDYLYFASANKSAEDFHEKVAESLQLFENCVLDYSLRACVYNNTLNNAMPVRLQVGLYVVYLLDWLTVFDKDQILVLRLEDHASNVKYTMHMVFQFLDLGPLTSLGLGGGGPPALIFGGCESSKER
ncbi:Carbohydrate sulfotransferase 15 [Aix galericulata]|nr:Carbohydrate sulfotransferase 15 [Aix galericulata]